MVVPILIFVVCFAGGAYAAAQWLPELGPGRIAGFAFFAVCGLLAAALALVGLHIYALVNELGERTAIPRGEITADVLRSVLIEAGTLTGLAAIVYLLAPRGADVASETAPQAAVSAPE